MASNGVTVMVDLCLAPDGKCACVEKMQEGPANSMSSPGNSPVNSCWRVRVPWWTMSATLLPNNRYTQLLTSSQAASQSASSSGFSSPVASDTDQLRRGANLRSQEATSSAARVRTPSPESDYSASHNMPPPRLVFAPPALHVSPISQVGGEDTTPASHEQGEDTKPSACEQQSEAEQGRPRRRRRQRRGTSLIIASQLKKLEDADPRCVFSVRNISSLGFSSPELLRHYFETFGAVDDILLANAHEKQTDGPHALRIRPSSLAFVRMRQAEDVQNVMDCGDSHVVNGITVHVRKFEHKLESSMESLAESDAEEN